MSKKSSKFCKHFTYGYGYVIHLSDPDRPGRTLCGCYGSIVNARSAFRQDYICGNCTHTNKYRENKKFQEAVNTWHDFRSLIGPLLRAYLEEKE